MFERFTDRARRTVVLAQEQARDLGHNYIGTEHLLLGLLAEPGNVAAESLTALGITTEGVRVAVRELIGEGGMAPSGHIPFTPRSKKVLELALREALALGHNYIGTEHILLGLVREGEGVAAQVLVSRGADLKTVREVVLAHLGSGGGPGLARSWTWRRRPRTPAADDIISAATALAGDAPVGSHHLLEALVRAEGSMAAAVLGALGVEADAISGLLDDLALEDTTDVTPEEAGARQMTLRIIDDEVHVVLRDPDTMERARSVEEAAGGPIEGSDPMAGAMVPLWNAVQNCLGAFQALLAPEVHEPESLSSRSLLVQRVIQNRLRRRRRPGGPATP